MGDGILAINYKRKNWDKNQSQLGKKNEKLRAKMRQSLLSSSEPFRLLMMKVEREIVDRKIRILS